MPETKLEKNIEVSQKEWAAVQEKLRMLEEVADKGRILNYQTKNSPIKKAITVKLSEYNGKYIIGWRTLKFELGRTPLTGNAIWGGETAEYEITLIDKEGNETKETISGYSAFSDAKYDKRVECVVMSKKETANGDLIFEVALPGGKTIEMESRYIN